MPYRLVLTILLVSVATLATLSTRTPADVVLTGGAVYTMNSLQPEARAVAVQAGRIVAVGDEAEVAGLIGPETVVYDLEGRMVLPGMMQGETRGLAPLSFIEEGVTLPDGKAPSLDQMLVGCTLHAAKKVGRERDLGTIDVGKLADLIVLEKDLYRVPLDQIEEVPVRLSLIDGVEAWRDPNFTPRP